MLAEALPLDRRRVSLEAVLAEAPAMTRVDRKYVVPLAVARTLLAGLDDSWGLLGIDGRTTTHYRSTYFDTPDLQAARDHVQGRRRRWKARSRLYVEDGLCRLEVKAKDGRGRTVKTVVDAPADGYGDLSLHDRAFVTRTLGHHRIRVDAARLHPAIEVSYERMTLARTDHDPARMTVDWDMRSRLGGHEVRLDEQHVLVETKGGPQPTDVDRALLRLGVRPRSFSKYTAAASLLRADIPDNDVRRLRGRILHVGPARPLEHPRSHTA